MSLDSLFIYKAILETVSFKIGFQVWKEVPLYSSSGALPPIDFLHWNSIKFNWITMGEATRCQLLALWSRDSLSSGTPTYQCWVSGKGLQREGCTNEHLCTVIRSKITTIVKSHLILGVEENSLYFYSSTQDVAYFFKMSSIQTQVYLKNVETLLFLVDWL